MELGELQNKYDAVNTKLADQEKALQEAAQKYNSAEGMYATRLRVIYENGIPSVIDILFSSQGISDFFSKMNVLTSILDYDKSLVGNMQSQKEYIDLIKSDIEVQKIQLQQLTYDKEKSAQALDNARVAKENKINQLQNDKTELNAQAKALEAAKKAAIKKVDDEIDRLAKISGTFSGKFAWPAPGKYYISAKFKEVYNVLGMAVHYGTDVPGPIGTPIVAMENGTVVIAGYNTGGYGNYVVIDHGYSDVDGVYYRTLYGHASSLAVVKGQKVTKGQTIAYIGNTGNSTGPHLHVEVRKNNTQVDTMQYFKNTGINFTYGSSRIPYPF
ncbi:Murein DD-endopeptidase MepM [compost metagenome]